MTAWERFKLPHDAGRAMRARSAFEPPGAGSEYCRRLNLPRGVLAVPLDAAVWLHQRTFEPVWLQLQQVPSIAYLARRRHTGEWAERLWDRRGDAPSFQIRQVSRIEDLWGYSEYPMIRDLFQERGNRRNHL